MINNSIKNFMKQMQRVILVINNYCLSIVRKIIILILVKIIAIKNILPNNDGLHNFINLY